MRDGYLFILPWLIGFLFFFLTPIVLSITFCFSNVSVGETGYTLNFVGFENFITALTKDGKYPEFLLNSILSVLSNVPIIVVFSFFVAVLLKQEFRGTAIVKAIFFLPIIMSSGLFAELQSNYRAEAASMVDTAFENSNALAVFSSDNISEYLMEIGIPSKWIDYFTGSINQIYSIITNSGIQIFIFLAGLNSISPSLYEASDIEGATGWEAFWKITFPLMTPMILVNVVYSIVDSFTSTTNSVMKYSYDLAFGNFNFGLSSAMSWVYFAILAVIMGVVTWLISRRTFYYT